MKIGIGIDTHRLVEGRPLILGGVVIPHHVGLLGHSDADVLVHAIMDALIGALGKGDIGKLFPDTDMAYKDISSMILLSEVYKLLKSENFTVINIDAVIVAEKPKMIYHIDEMKKNIADVLKISTDQINIKATTEEGLGFVGRQEGISAHCVCLIDFDTKNIRFI